MSDGSGVAARLEIVALRLSPSGHVVADADRYVLVSVTDGSPALPRQRPLDQVSCTGRGLRLLRILGVTSGTDGSDAVRPGGTSVWFTVIKQTGEQEQHSSAAGASALFGVDLDGAW